MSNAFMLIEYLTTCVFTRGRKVARKKSFPGFQKTSQFFKQNIHFDQEIFRINFDLKYCDRGIIIFVEKYIARAKQALDIFEINDGLAKNFVFFNDIIFPSGDTSNEKRINYNKSFIFPITFRIYIRFVKLILGKARKFRMKRNSRQIIYFKIFHDGI